MSPSRNQTPGAMMRSVSGFASERETSRARPPNAVNASINTARRRLMTTPYPVYCTPIPQRSVRNLGFNRGDHHIVFHGEVHRPRETADLVGTLVNRGGIRDARWVGNHHTGMQDHAREFTRAIGMLRHLSGRLVGVFGNHNAGVGAQMQDPEHVTSGECADQHLFGVVARAVAAKHRVGGAADGSLLASLLTSQLRLYSRYPDVPVPRLPVHR